MPAVILHWTMALLIFGLFAVGLYMTSLDYYHPWYKSIPWWHKSFGLVLFSLLCIRLGVRLISQKPAHLTTHKAWEIRLAAAVHRLLYLLLFAICISGYLISTADGRGIELFGWVEIPALVQGVEGQEDIAGQIHLVLAITAMGLVAMHAAGALKHHFIDKDSTLKRMFGRN